MGGGIRRKQTYLTCKMCGKTFKSLGFARHRASCIEKQKEKQLKLNSNLEKQC